MVQTCQCFVLAWSEIHIHIPGLPEDTFSPIPTHLHTATLNFYREEVIAKATYVLAVGPRTKYTTRQPRHLSHKRHNGQHGSGLATTETIGIDATSLTLLLRGRISNLLSTCRTKTLLSSPTMAACLTSTDRLRYRIANEQSWPCVAGNTRAFKFTDQFLQLMLSSLGLCF